MPTDIRRVVVGHNAEGHATVIYDDVKRITGTSWPDNDAPLWITRGFPISNEGSEDTTTGEATWKDGTIFRVIAFPPGAPGSMHRTDSTDYIVVVSGEIDMEMDDGSSVHLKAGDTMVQRGTAHSWINRGTETCLAAFVMIQSEVVPGLPEIAR